MHCTGRFFKIVFLPCTLLDSALLHLAPLRFHCDRGCCGIEPRTVVTMTLAVRHTLTTRINLIHIRLDLIHFRLDIIHTRLDLIHNSAKPHPHSARSYPPSARSHSPLARSQPHCLSSFSLWKLESTLVVFPLCL